MSEYTDKIDIISSRDKVKRIHEQLKDVCSILSGLLLASDFNEGQKLIKNKNFSDYAPFFQSVFELGRRYKVLNPAKLRAGYGKLVYMLMDSQNPQLKELLDFSCVRPIKTVYGLLKDNSKLIFQSVK